MPTDLIVRPLCTTRKTVGVGHGSIFQHRLVARAQLKLKTGGGKHTVELVHNPFTLTVNGSLKGKKVGRGGAGARTCSRRLLLARGAQRGTHRPIRCQRTKFCLLHVQPVHALP